MVKDENCDYIIRDACIKDINDIYFLSKFLNTVNLPAHKNELEQVILNSEKSFSLQEKESIKRAFLFALSDPNDRVIGTSQIFAKHGTLQSPHLYFQVDLNERYSKTLKKYFRHRTLRLYQSFDGPTEIGSLVLHKNYRSTPQKLGRNLSYVRFLFMAMRKDFFSHRILAELLPPLGPNFESALWEGVGRKFTGLDYYEADMLSRKNKEFITTLFPTQEIYVSLLPNNAQEVIGQVGRHSKGAGHLLSKIGFSYSHRVDPFDGGPYFEADQDNVSLIKATIHGRAKIITDFFEKQVSIGLCGRYLPKMPSGSRFRAIVSPYCNVKDHQIGLPSFTLSSLQINEDEEVSVIDLSKH
jgi:arginine N-succinyltransferase